MTYEEALKTLDETVIGNLALKVVLSEAVEKQIPKKPMAYKGYEGQCVTCGAVFLDKSTKHCGNCGQALDWSDIE